MKQKCNKCKEEKELNKDNFYKSGSYSNGFMHECKECMKERGRKAKDKKQQSESNFFKHWL
jgi:hypothetical protein